MIRRNVIIWSICLAFIFFAISLNTHAQSITAGQSQKLKGAKQGEIVYLENFFDQDFPKIQYEKIVLPGPQYIISDDPEYIRVPEAIVLQEALQPGAVRLYLYNVNGVEKPRKIERKITVILKNTGMDHMHVKMLKNTLQSPGTDYFRIAKKSLTDYFSNPISHNEKIIAPGKAISIDEKLERNLVNYNELVHGIFEFVIDQPGELTVVQTDPETEGGQALADIHTIHPPSHINAGRGIFGISNYLIKVGDTLDTAAGITALIIADGKQDQWIKGIDTGTGQVTRLAGNYGVIYNIELNWKSTNGMRLALITWNPHSGESRYCGGMANAMIVSEGKFPEGVIQIPSDRLITTGAPEAVLIQVFEPSETEDINPIEITYSPPGASCLPTPLIFIPFK